MLVDSKKQQLGVEPIIVIAAQETKAQEPVATVYATIVAEMNMQGCTLFQEGNTLFVVHHLASREGMFRALNADTAQNYLQNSMVFVQAAHRFGYDVLRTEFDDPRILNIFKMIERNPPMPDMSFESEKSGSGYAVTLYLGAPRERES
jgi:hypothetical protein